MEFSVHDVTSVARGYFYECSCGERYSKMGLAMVCRKCRTYTQEGRCTAVYDIAHQELVWTCPTVVAEKERQAQLEAYIAECKKPFTLGDVCPGLDDVLESMR
jgi:hypothetical protein